MSLAAFVSLEDISTELPSYTEQVIGVPMDAPLQAAYQALEEEIKNAIKEHHMNHSVISVGLNALLLYPDHAWKIGDLYGYEYDPETQRRERFLIAQPEDLDQEFVYAKERRLVEIVKAELRAGRRCCHVYAVYTRKRDVTRRLESILAREGIRVAVLTSDVPPEKREGWFAQKAARGSSSYDQPSQNYRDWDRSAEPPQPDLFRVRLLAAHAPAGQQALVEDRTTPAGSRLLPTL